MRPMVFTSTPFLSYHDIKTEGIDLFEDAFGLNAEFYDVIELLKQVKPVSQKGLTSRLIGKIRKSH